MLVFSTKSELRAWLTERPRRGRTLVPTMGALHRGHTSLFDLARAKRPDGDLIATIFVNPLQFGPSEDFSAYPRPHEADLALCRDHGVTAVFAPSGAEMYAADASITVAESQLSRDFCGASRQGHFDGVVTVVSKLFNLVEPEIAVFGEKDFQQLAIIRRLVRDLNFLIEIAAGPTAREKDGLALSSRNVYLSGAEREQAPIIRAALQSVAANITSGTFPDPASALASLKYTITTKPLAVIDYLGLVHAETLVPLTTFSSHPARLLAAVFFGRTRLIDNVAVLPLGSS